MVVLMNFPLYKGGTCVTLPRFELEQFLKTVQDYKITHLYIVPPIVVALAKHPLVEKYDLSSVKEIGSGAAPLDEHTAQLAQQRTRAGKIFQGYGMTETSCASHIIPPDESQAKIGAVGVPVANMACKIVDPATGQEVGPNQLGEIWMRGPNIMKGYLNNPEATAQTIDDEGWLHSGDIGYVDEDGFFYVVDRLKELIKYKGLQVAPAELEAVLLSHPAVADAAVIPIPDEDAGEVFVLDSKGNVRTFKGGKLLDMTRVEDQRDGKVIALRVQPYTGERYLIDKYDKVVKVLRGWHEIARIPIPFGKYSQYMAIDPFTGTVYVTDSYNDTLTVIRGTEGLDTIQTGWHPSTLGINPAHGWVYVVNIGDSTVSVLGYPPAN